VLGEFELIQRYFMSPQETHATAGIALGNGDDAALLVPQTGQQLVVSVDSSVVDVHFPHDAPAHAIGHRALAVALSDLAAMGATARWSLMALTLDKSVFTDRAAAEQWLAEYAKGFHALCQQHATALVGGDVTSGALTIGVTVMGEVPSGMALTRSGAQVGDVIAVTGALGGGAGGLVLWRQGERELTHPLIARYLLPQPRLAAGVALRGLATAVMDISDGLLADLGHLRKASQVGCSLEVDALPLAEGLQEALGLEAARKAALSGGDDYELLVTLAPENVETARRRLTELGVALTVIGHCNDNPGVTGVAHSDNEGWQHFSGVAP
jgi:thiamine-monophosphate kinase